MKPNRYELPALPVLGDLTAAAFAARCNALVTALASDRKDIERSKQDADERKLTQVAALRTQELREVDAFLLELAVIRHTGVAEANRRDAEVARAEAEKARPAVDAAQKKLDALRPAFEAAEAALKAARRSHDGHAGRAESREQAAQRADSDAAKAQDAIDYPNGRPRVGLSRSVAPDRTLDEELALLPSR